MDCLSAKHVQLGPYVTLKMKVSDGFMLNVSGLISFEAVYLPTYRGGTLSILVVAMTCGGRQCALYDDYDYT